MLSIMNYRRLTFLLLISTIVVCFPVKANIYYDESMVSAQVADMFRYGDVNAALFTGKINLSIPIYSLKDPDFKLDISLSYNSEAFKPRKYSGYIGYNWFLNAGGSITREVRNIPDEISRETDVPTDETFEFGMLNYLKNETMFDKDKVFNFDSTIFSNCGVVRNSRLGDDCDKIIDYQPDIFHFNFCGYQGCFMINNNGDPVIVSGDFMNVDLSETIYDCPLITDNKTPTPNETSKISIRTNDGYTYIFGGELAAIEYNIMTKDGQRYEEQQPIPTILTWHLTKIIAPNKRTITFYYKPMCDNLWQLNEYYTYFKPKNQEELKQLKSNNNLGYNMTKESILDSVVVSGTHRLRVRFYNHIDNKPLYYKHSRYDLAKPNFMLDSIVVSTKDNVLKKAHLTSIYKSHLYDTVSASGYNWRFLSSVFIEGIGQYSFAYIHSGAYPDLSILELGDNAKRTTFDGYWIDNKFQGLLSEVVFPTGGKQKYSYGQHKYGYMCRFFAENNNVSRICTTDIGAPAYLGVRIEEIKTYDGDDNLVETKTYSYIKSNTNKSSGIYWDKNKVQNGSNLMLINNNNNYSFLESNIGYSRVEEKCILHETNETNTTEYLFHVDDTYYNSFYDNSISRSDSLFFQDSLYAIYSGVLTYDNQLSPQGNLLSIKYYNENKLVHSKLFEYNGISSNTELTPMSPKLGCVDTIIIFSFFDFSPLVRKLFVYPPVLTQEITYDYSSDGYSLFNAKRYEYDNQYRIKKITTTNSDNTEYFTKYTYVDDILTLNNLNFSNPYSLLDRKCMKSEPLETISGYVHNGQEYITSGKINLYTNGVYEGTHSQSISDLPFPCNLEQDTYCTSDDDSSIDLIQESSIIDEVNIYPYLYQTLELQVHNSITNYQPIELSGYTLQYDQRYKKVCQYTFDPLYRLTDITPSNKITTTYTWDGIYPRSKTIGNQVDLYSHIPYIGIDTIIDARGLLTGYNYDLHGRLKNIYQIHDETVNILNAYDYHIKSADSDTANYQYNYIVDICPLQPISSIMFDSQNMCVNNNVMSNTTITYYDDLGRPYENVIVGGSPNGSDLVSMNTYSGLNRSIYKWLPIPIDINGTPITPENFSTQANNFYNDSRPYQETRYESSALDREVGIKLPGVDYAGHSTMLSYDVNTENDAVRIFSVVQNDLANGDVVTKLRCAQNYSAYTLYKNTSLDEDGKGIITYVDKLGRKILERQEGHDTYYVYDYKGQLCYVLPPLVASQITEGIHSDTEDILKKYAYIYKYDKRGNQIYKRLPGCEPILMVYDNSNTLVLSQTGNQRERGTLWTVYKYDELRRLIYTAEVDIETNNHEELMDNFSQWYVVEYFSTESQTYPMANTGYSRGYYHTQPTRLLTVNYYDNYDFLTYVADNKRSNMEFSAFAGNDSYASAIGLLTGSRTYYLDDSGNYSETVYYYDYRGREIQRRSTNHLGGYDALSTKYDFANNIVDTWSNHSVGNEITTVEHYHYTFDNNNRPLTTIYTFNNEAPITLQAYHYDDLGRMRCRYLHGGIDSVLYTYNIRDQITQIKSSGYEQKYYYNQVCPISGSSMTVNYNGNVSATTWTYGNAINGYNYFYDRMDRLSSTYSFLNNQWGDAKFSETYSYDAHGNIIHLNRWDSQSVIDYLSFNYDGNQLIDVNDEFNTENYATKQYHDNNELNDFIYDANGNMLYDRDRGIATIRYNLLNLPDTIQFTDGNQIIHRYDASGNRLATDYYTRKLNISVPLGKVFSAADSISKYYLTRDVFHEHFVYNLNNINQYTIKFVHNPEGYIRYYGPEEHYHFYHIKDLLGNVRETYVHPWADYKECVQRMQYYPSGLPWSDVMGTSEQPYKYNGKEFIEMHGLDEYDNEARWYYPAICRTTTMDPLAEKYYSTSPYAWCGNNSVNMMDPDGMEIHIIGENDSVTVYNINTTYDGSDIFTASIYDELNTLDAMLSNTDFISSLVNSPNIYKVSPTNSTIEETYTFVNNTINIGTNHGMDYLGHELFHAYQDVKGQGGASIHNEVEAYLFQAKILFMNNFGAGISPLLGAEYSTPVYDNIVNALIYESYNQTNFNQTVELFKANSNANASRIYNNYPLIRNNQTKSLIKSFYPIYP